MKDARSPGERVLVEAEALVGMREEGGPNSGPPVERFAGGRSEPWCGHFLATLFREDGHPLPGDIAPTLQQPNPIARVSVMWDLLAAAGWTQPPQATCFAGDLFFLRTRAGSDPGLGWHVGLVEKVQGPWIGCLSGNWRDSVARHRLHPHEKNLVGFARVPR